jgi:hypothetical protein
LSFYRARCSYEIQDYDKTLSIIEYCGDIELSDDVRDYLKPYSEELAEIQEQITKQH